jgi:hypothetical protein
MKNLIISLLFICAINETMFAQAVWVHFNDRGVLVYSNDNMGNHLIDYSYAGYEGGGVAIPTNQTVEQVVNVVSGDNTANIQNAINYVGSLTPDTNGFRGVVLLKAAKVSLDARGITRSIWRNRLLARKPPALSPRAAFMRMTRSKVT